MTRLQTCCALAIMAWVFSLEAQENQTPTLHAYTNLIQIPVLVLGPDWSTHRPVSADRFLVGLDGGKPISPRHVRLEGDDPIDLGILLDVSDREDSLLPQIGSALRQLTPTYLKRLDHVSIYAMDCELLRSTMSGPPDGAKLELIVDAALKHWADYHQQLKGHTCRQDVPLLDALTFATDDVAKMNGRHVILAITSGRDQGSRRKWNEVRLFAQQNGVAIFGLRNQSDRGRGAQGEVEQREDNFNIMCQLTGGIVMSASVHGLPDRLERFINMLRDRYIVEFPRSNRVTAGPHSIVVSIADPSAIIRPTGIAVPLADASLLANPSTVPSDNTLAPEPGQRRILIVPH